MTAIEISFKNLDNFWKIGIWSEKSSKLVKNITILAIVDPENDQYFGIFHNQIPTHCTNVVDGEHISLLFSTNKF